MNPTVYGVTQPIRAANYRRPAAAILIHRKRLMIDPETTLLPLQYTEPMMHRTRLTMDQILLPEP